MAGGGVFPPFDQSTFASQLLWLAITFGLFYLLMSKVIVPRIGGILEHRRDRIAQDLDEANRLKEEADNAIAAYEQELADARKKASAIAEAAREKAKAAADAERVSTEAELNAKMADAEKASRPSRPRRWLTSTRLPKTPRPTWSSIFSAAP
jgi:F-type H+-transporting ATPase subunit b